MVPNKYTKSPLDALHQQNDFSPLPVKDGHGNKYAIST